MYGWPELENSIECYCWALQQVMSNFGSDRVIIFNLCLVILLWNKGSLCVCSMSYVVFCMQCQVLHLLF